MRRCFFLPLLIILLAFSACGRPDSTPESAPTQKTETPTASTPAPTSPGKPGQRLIEYPEVILGKDNWLFFGTPINNLLRDGGLTDAQIERDIKELSYISNSLENQGVHLLFVLASDKHLVYPEFMPNVYKESAVPSSYDRLSKAMSEPSIDVIDTKPLMLEKKKETGNRLYYMRDQNWNSLGNFYVMQEILSHLGKTLPVPKFELTSVDTSETRVCETENCNDLNEIIKNLSPWYERGAPEPVYEVQSEPQAPAILWYGDCFSPGLIAMMQKDWPGEITYVPVWEQYGFPLSFREDIKQRLESQKVVIIELDEHYRQELTRALIPEAPKIDLASFNQEYLWRANSFLRNWRPGDDYNTRLDKGVALVETKNPASAISFYTTTQISMEPSKKYYVAINITSPVNSGMFFDFSKTLKGDYSMGGRWAQYVYKGDNTILFEFPDPDKWGTVKSVRITLGNEPGVYGISQIGIYSKPK